MLILLQFDEFYFEFSTCIQSFEVSTNNESEHLTEKRKEYNMSRNIHIQHQRSSSTGSHGLLFGIGAAAGPHHVVNHHAPIAHQMSSPSTDPLTDEDEDSLEETESLELKGIRVLISGVHQVLDNSIAKNIQISRKAEKLFKVSLHFSYAVQISLHFDKKF